MRIMIHGRITLSILHKDLNDLNSQLLKANAHHAGVSLELIFNIGATVDFETVGTLSKLK